MSRSISSFRARAGSHLTKVCAWLALLLHRLVLLLEDMIERLGYEPSRRWECFLEYEDGHESAVSVLDAAGSDSLCRRARQLAEKGRLESALKLYVRVLEGDPDNAAAMDAAAELLAELGDVEGARALLDRSIEIAPDEDHAKFVLLGHLEHGRDALRAFERGLDLLKREQRRLGLGSDERHHEGDDTGSPDGGRTGGDGGENVDPTAANGRAGKDPADVRSSAAKAVPGVTPADHLGDRLRSGQSTSSSGSSGGGHHHDRRQPQVVSGPALPVATAGFYDGFSRTELEDRKVVVESQLSEVMVAMAKVYLTDCFNEAGASESCESILDTALLMNPDNAEACQALADLRLSQDRRGEALLLIKRTLDLCSLKKASAAAGDVGSKAGGPTASAGGGLPAYLPSYDFRLVTGRLLVELSQYHLAHEVLEECASDDPEDTEVFYLLGLCHIVRGKTKEGRSALATARALLESSGDRDSRLREQIDSLLLRDRISEEEKQRFWNPRWWVHADSTAQQERPRARDGADGPIGERAGRGQASLTVMGIQGGAEDGTDGMPEAQSGLNLETSSLLV